MHEIIIARAFIYIFIHMPKHNWDEQTGKRPQTDKEKTKIVVKLTNLFLSSFFDAVLPIFC